MNYSEREKADFLLRELPNSTAVLWLGILSIAVCWCFGAVGLALSIIALVMASKSEKLYVGNPGQYSNSSYRNMQSGKICAIIGICLNGLFIIYVVFKMLLFGFLAFLAFLPWSNIF